MRKGFTLVELLVVIAIIAVLLGLLLTAVSLVRNTASRIDCENKQHQLGIAITNYTSGRSGNFPELHSSFDWQEDLFVALVPFLEGEIYSLLQDGNDNPFFIRTYSCPVDPTIQPNNYGLASYAANAQLFGSWRNVASGLPDGTSNTILFAEHYSTDCGGTTSFSWSESLNEPPVAGSVLVLRRAAFADSGPGVPQLYLNGITFETGDVYPVTNGSPPISVGSVANLTFQVSPSIKNCDPRIPQTPHSGGMPTLFADGSVRILSKGVSETVFWGMVTPAGGEAIGGDW